MQIKRRKKEEKKRNKKEEKKEEEEEENFVRDAAPRISRSSSNFNGLCRKTCQMILIMLSNDTDYADASMLNADTDAYANCDIDAVADADIDAAVYDE